MKPLYILAALLLTACTKQAIDWDSVDYGVRYPATVKKDESTK